MATIKVSPFSAQTYFDCPVQALYPVFAFHLCSLPLPNALKMAAFSYHHHHPLGAAAYLPDPSSFNLPLLAPPPQHQQAADLPVPLSRFPCYYRPLDPAAAGASAETTAAGVQTAAATVPNTAAESSSSLSTGGDHWVASSSSSSAQLSEVASRTAQSSMEKKRKEKQRWNPAQSNNGKENKRRKQKKYGAALGKEAEEKKKAPQEPPTGYIHVRARRGQATDSHSLAERARREKISERMKMLQGLVPGCDKVVGKALMLDEIINYVQSLQNQVEFLSMKLASVNPILFESCFDLKYMDGSEKLELMSPAVLSVQRGSHIQPTATVETTNNYPVQDASVSFFLDGLGPNAFPIQDNGNNYAMQLGDNRQRLLHQTESNMCSFQ